MAAMRFVFVHGAWHGAWCFDLIRHELKHRAIQCDGVDMPALGDDATPGETATFEAGVERVMGLIGGKRNVILVAHSFGAFYATEAAVRTSNKLKALVYLSSYVPVPGDTFQIADELAPTSEEFKGAWKKSEKGESLIIDPSQAIEYFYHDVPEGIAFAAASRLRPQPIEPFTNAVISEGGADLRKIKRRVIVSEEDRVLSPDACVAMADRAEVEVETIPAGHCSFLSMPKLLADMLLGVA